MARHLVLVGLSGAGKTTVGQLAATALGAPFADLDTVIERAAGRTINEIFAEQGEPAFRTWEREAMEAALAGPPAIVAAGGGWAAHPGNLEAAEARAIVLYLNTRPENAARRLASANDRPLLGGDPRTALGRLLVHRRSFYEAADAVIFTDDRTPDQVAGDVVALARERGGW